MVTTIDDAKRIAIATTLAEMQAMQSALIANEQKLISACTDEDIYERLNDMYADDQKNLKIIETVVVQYGVRAEPKERFRKSIAEFNRLMDSSELTLYEKITQQELLKHKQVLNGLVVHKAAQVVGADVEAAIVPLNAVNFENRAHQEQLKGILEILGVRELTGRDARQGIWARVQDAIAAMSGAAGSAASHSREDTRVQDLIRMDHQKAKLLFQEIQRADDPNQVQEFFTQLYQDLLVHANAEEQIVYPAVRSIYGDQNTQLLYDEQAEMKQWLDRIRAISPAAPEFKTEVQRLQEIVNRHVDQEERDLFSAMRDRCTRAEVEQLAVDFQAAKSRLQQQGL